MTGFDDWILEIRTEVYAKCGQGMDGYNWMLEIEDKELTFEYLGTPGDAFLTIDAKILRAATKLLGDDTLSMAIKAKQREMAMNSRCSQADR